MAFIYCLSNVLQDLNLEDLFSTISMISYNNYLIFETFFSQHLLNNEDKLLPASHPYYQRVTRVAERLIKANPEMMKLLGSETWQYHVISDPTVINAFVLPVSVQLTKDYEIQGLVLLKIR